MTAIPFSEAISLIPASFSLASTASKSDSLKPHPSLVDNPFARISMRAIVC